MALMNESVATQRTELLFLAGHMLSARPCQGQFIHGGGRGGIGDILQLRKGTKLGELSTHKREIQSIYRLERGVKLTKRSFN